MYTMALPPAWPKDRQNLSSQLALVQTIGAEEPATEEADTDDNKVKTILARALEAANDNIRAATDEIGRAFATLRQFDWESALPSAFQSERGVRDGLGSMLLVDANGSDSPRAPELARATAACAASQATTPRRAGGGFARKATPRSSSSPTWRQRFRGSASSAPRRSSARTTNYGVQEDLGTATRSGS